MDSSSGGGGMFSGLDVLGGMTTSLFNAGLQDQANHRAFRNTIDLFNRTNEYNTPLNQRKRLIAGGYNPNLYAGGNSGMASMPSTPEVHALKAPDVQDILQKFANLNKTKEDTSLATAQVANVVADSVLKGVQTGESLARTNSTNTLLPLNVDALKESNRQKDLENQKLIFDNSNLSVNQKQRLAEGYARITNLLSSAGLNHANTQKSVVSTAVEEEELKNRKMGTSFSDSPVTRSFYNYVVPALRNTFGSGKDAPKKALNSVFPGNYRPGF